MNIQKFLSKKVLIAFSKIGIPFSGKIKVIPSKVSKFGDYQVNSIMNISKSLNIDSMILASKIVFFLQLDRIFQKIEIKFPGFINIFLCNFWISKQLNYMLYCPRLGIKKQKSKKIIIDYSSPNMAKEMHVGHIRSTIIGDVISRMLKFQGHIVMQINHIGDWGNQFGILIAYIKKYKIKIKKNTSLYILGKLYYKAHKEYSFDKIFCQFTHLCVLNLQKRDPFCIKIWKILIFISIKENQKIYKKLNVNLKKKNIMGESFYRDMLDHVVQDLKKKKIAVFYHGAIVVFLKDVIDLYDGLKKIVIQKSDGSFLYSTIEIACLKYRYRYLQANRIIYLVDSRQKLHFLYVWSISEKAGYIPKNFKLNHYICGMVLKENKKPFKTREGNYIRLSYLLSQSIKKAWFLIKKKNPCIDIDKLRYLSENIGINSIKYNELSRNRMSNYTFCLKSMINFNGNTILYIQYTYVRIISLFKKTNTFFKVPIYFLLNTIQERKIAVHLLKYEEVIVASTKYGFPHMLCDYLYKLSVLFSCFYEKYKILLLQDSLLKFSRLQLSLLISKVIKHSLFLLGINVVNEI